MSANRGTSAVAPSASRPDGPFVPTRWTLVFAARGSARSAVSERALADLCAAYWRPLYLFARRLGHPPHEAEDLTQGFFAVLLAKDYLAGVDRARGRFRSFLLASFRHFMSNERDRERAKKRGGGATIVRLDAAGAEDRRRFEPSHGETPERIFERQWALTVLERVLARLRAEYAARGREAVFDALKDRLDGGGRSGAAAPAGLSEGAARVAIHRLRARYRTLLRAEIACTVERDEQIDEEIRHLLQALGDGG